MHRLAGFSLAVALALALALALGPGSAPLHASGFQFVDIPGDESSPVITTAIWYPSETSPPDAPNSPFGQAVAMHAPLADTDLPLVVISHGDGGWFGGHARIARALSDAGIVAVALNHPGNSDGDETATPGQWIAERPEHLARVVDFLTSRWEAAAHIDATRLGAFGFSAGAHSVMVAAGARFSPERVSVHCAQNPSEFVCRTGMAADVVQRARALPPPIPGLSAVVAAAPGFGFGFDPKQIAEIDAAFQIWSGLLDERVPHASNVAPLADVLNHRSSVRAVPDAGHFAFRAPCDTALKEARPRIWELACVDAPGFDRAGFHEQFTAEVVAFLTRELIAD